MSLPFREATRLQSVREGVFSANVPDGWQQGRGAFGGLVLGYLVRGVLTTEHDASRTLRTLSADIVGPLLPGPAEVHVRELRRGRSQTNMQMELLQQGEVLASGVCTLSTPRPADVPPVVPSAPALARSPWREAPVTGIRPPFGPVFAQHYEFRNLGPAPFSGASEATTAGFVRELGADGPLDAASVTALLDSYFPTLLTTRTAPTATATISFASQYFAGDEPLSADEPLFLHARMVTQRDGYFVEFRELWHGDRLVALNQQTFAVLK